MTTVAISPSPNSHLSSARRTEWSHSNNLGLVPRRQVSSLFPSDMGYRYSEQRSESTTNEGAPMAEGYLRRPTASVTEEKRQRRSSLSTPTVHSHTCLPPKSETADSNQSNWSVRPTGARAAGRLLRVYKASPVVPKSFRLVSARVRKR